MDFVFVVNIIIQSNDAAVVFKLVLFRGTSEIWFCPLLCCSDILEQFREEISSVLSNFTSSTTLHGLNAIVVTQLITTLHNSGVLR